MSTHEFYLEAKEFQENIFASTIFEENTQKQKRINEIQSKFSILIVFSMHSIA